MQRVFSRELVILVALVGLIAGYSAWNARRVEPTASPTPIPPDFSEMLGTETPAPVVVQGTPMPPPKARPPHVAVKKKPRPRNYHPYSAPPSRPGEYEEGGDSLIVH